MIQLLHRSQFFCYMILRLQIETSKTRRKSPEIDAQFFLCWPRISLSSPRQETRQSIGRFHGRRDGLVADFCQPSTRRVLWPRSGVVSVDQRGGNCPGTHLFALGNSGPGSLLDPNLARRAGGLWGDFTERRCFHRNGQHGAALHPKGSRAEGVTGGFEPDGGCGRKTKNHQTIEHQIELSSKQEVAGMRRLSPLASFPKMVNNVAVSSIVLDIIVGAS